MHGPSHLFCNGGAPEALALAAWAGWHASNQAHEKAAGYAERAVQTRGRHVMTMPNLGARGQFELWLTGSGDGDLSSKALEFMAEALRQHAAYWREYERKAALAPPAGTDWCI